MGTLSNTAKLIGTYCGNEVTNESAYSVQDIGTLMSKTGDRIYGDIGTTINYTIMITTESLVPTDLKLTDVMDDGLEFVEGSLKLDGVSKTGTVSELVISYEPNSLYTITYQAIKTKAGDLRNYAYLTGTYCADAVTSMGIWVLKDTGNSIFKVGDREYADIGTVTNFTITITIGELCPSDLTFVDEMEDGLEFVDGTLELNGVPQVGSIFDLSIDFEPNTTYEITYQALKVSVGE